MAHSTPTDKNQALLSSLSTHPLAPSVKKKPPHLKQQQRNVDGGFGG
jgi:hypothetical protein